ncbi:hypothetical protein UA08_08845 [Talaromyces atroroseus]|uniref:Uncharacterized protein n=1 Tax=Talaromyces atroroseus TaxID=1441469 RepID=A0A225A7S3_TALAT|nr:hypothetical protein UA08_08845 [Talaromyces atroroseus]OKL55880.1 hypothetical protein UA08_08845 [Talaromyces atroroseus]
MTGSALLGEPPATPDDSLIYKALVILNGSDSFPNPTQYADAVKPPNDFDGNSQLSADVALLIIVVLSTAARVWAQRYRKKRHVAFWMSNVFLFLSTCAVGHNCL